MTDTANGNPTPHLLGRLKDPRHPRLAHLLFLAPTPLILMLIVGDARERVFALVLLALFGGAIWLLRKGLDAARAYEKAEITRRPKWPLKLIAAPVAGSAVAVLSAANGNSATEVALTFLFATVLFIVAFGPDPLKNKGLDSVQAVDKLRAGAAISGAEAVLGKIGDALAPLADPAIEACDQRFHGSATHLFNAVRSDPVRLRSQRRHLGVFLVAAQEATEKFVVIHRGTGDPESKARYLEMLNDLAEKLDSRARQYLMDAKPALDVEIEVLSERLRAETRRA